MALKFMFSHGFGRENWKKYNLYSCLKAKFYFFCGTACHFQFVIKVFAKYVAQKWYLMVLLAMLALCHAALLELKIKVKVLEN